MKIKHTPGPWKVEVGLTGLIEVVSTRPCRINLTTGGTPIICEVFRHDDAETFSGKSNAALIAAAPDLLEALVELSKSFIGAYTNDQRSDDEIDDHRLLWENKARELIARITGDTK